MKNLHFIIYFISLSLFFNHCTIKTPDNFIYVKGGSVKNKNSKLFEKKLKIKDFFIAKYEVTQKEWTEIMGYNPSRFKGDSLPVETVSWYECIEFCNKKSMKDGLKPYYIIDTINKDFINADDFDSIKWTVGIDEKANGYRLPTEAEWEYAATGGNKSKNFKYSGSNDLNEIGWFWQNSGDKFLNSGWYWPMLEQNHCRTHNVGSKKPNELGIYDMSGNVREWCWDVHYKSNPYDLTGRIWKGGGWIGADFCCEPSYTGYLQASGKGADQGFRLCRNK